jgi:flavodoxin
MNEKRRNFLKGAIIETTALSLGAVAFNGCSSKVTNANNKYPYRNIQEIKDTDSQAGNSSQLLETHMNNVPPMKSLLLLVSYHHKNTEKIANVFSRVLDAQIKKPQQVTVTELQEYGLIGFGSGIYDQKHHKYILGLADKLPYLANRKVFIYSTSGVSRKFAIKHSIDDPHTVLREKLLSKGCTIIDEFNCTGWDTNSFLKIIGGINWGKPDAKDLKRAEEFARNMMLNISAQQPLQSTSKSIE